VTVKFVEEASGMKALAKMCRVLGKVWIGLAFVVVLIGYAGTFMKRGFWALQELVNPFNIGNYIAVIITFLPGFLMLMAADALAKGQRKAGLRNLAFVPVAVVLVVLMFALFFQDRDRKKAAQNDGRVSEYRAVAVRVKNGSGKMLEHRNYGITKTSGSVGSEGIPATIKLGDVVSVSGRSLTVRHIFVSEYNADMKYGREVLARKGDVSCVLVENEQDRPDDDDGRDRRWIYVKECEPMERH
jgi:hypothetical protein